MSLDLFEREVTERVETAPGFERPEPGAWDGFLRGSAQHTMQGFAKAARSMSMGGAVLPIVYDKFTDGTEAQDRFFKAHEDIFKRAVDYWTPNPGEVGMAGEITGQLLSLLPIVIASPGGAVATTQLSVAEDLMAKGVDPGKAQAVGAAYGAGIGLGIWVPILGKTLPQRMLLGGAGFNVSQGIAMRGVAGEILKGTPAEGDFRMLSPEDLAIDTILGLAFGGLAHLSPAMRAQGDEFWNKVEAWRRNLTPEQIEALGAIRQAQHAAVDSFPGKPRTPEAVDAHVDRVRAAVDQLARDEPVNVADMAPVEATPDRARLDAAGARAAELVREGERVRQEEGLAQPPDIAAEYGHGTRETLLGVRGTPEPGTAEILPGVPRGVSAQGAPEGAQAQPGRLDLTQLPPEHQPRAIGRAVEDALTRINIAPEEARANASIWEAFFKTAAERYKIPAARILEQYNPEIRRLGEQEDLPGALAQPLSDAERAEKTARFKQLKAETKVLADKGGLTRSEAEQFKKLTNESTQLLFDLARPLEAEKIPPEAERLSTLPASTVLLAREALLGNREIYAALSEAAVGVHFNANTAVDNIMEGRNPQVSAQQFYAVFEPVRAALRQQHGDTITLYRATGLQRDKATQNWATTREFAAQFGQDVIKREVPIDDVLAVHVSLNGKYHEVIVGKAPTTPTTLFQSLPGQPRFYSELQRSLEAVKQESASPEQWKGMVQNLKGVKRDEIHWSGLEEWLEIQKGPVTKQEVLDFLAGNAVRVEEVLLGPEPRLGTDETSRLRTMDQNAVDAHTDRLSNLGWEVVRDENGVLFRDARSIDAEPMSLQEMEEYGATYGEPIPPPVLDAARMIAEASDRGDTGTTNPTKHATYQLPGGENYRELLIQLTPKKGEHTFKVVERGTAGYEVVRDDGEGFGRWSSSEESLREAEAHAARLNAGEIPSAQGAFTGGHWDEPDVLAHVRFNERTDAEGKRVLFIEELQSDWAQQGRKQGFKQPKLDALPEGYSVKLLEGEGTTYAVAEPNGRLMPDTTSRTREGAERFGLRELNKPRIGGIPRAPFVEKTDAWVGLALKRMIAWAVENGFDRVAWTRGEQQVERWTSALRKHVDAIEWTKTEKGVQLVGYKGKESDGLSENERARAALLEDLGARGRLNAEQATELRRINQHRRPAGRNKVVDTTQREDELSDAIGKAMADKILKDPAQSGTIEGENIRVDDTGMHGFYDRILPTVANEVLKKLGGGKVGEIDLHLPAKTDERPPIRPMIDPGPDFEDMPVGAREGASGAEDFPDGEPPLYSETKIKIGDQVVDVGIIIAKDGIHVVDSDASFELALTFNALGRQQDGRTQDAALTWVTRNWGKPAFWNAMEVITGELPGTKGAMAGKQMSFDITPEMIERAKKGLPLFQAGRGQIQFGDRQTVIGLFENADASTFVHETGHFFLQATKDLASRATAPEQAVRDWGTLATWLKIEGGEITREQHEQFARGFETYLAEGKAPTQGLARVFEQFKQWLLEIYHSLSELDVHLTDEVRGVMDRMLGAPEAEGPAGQATGREPPPPRQGAQPAGSAAQRREREPSALLRDIRDLGGINQNQLGEITGETRFGKMKGLPWGVFRPQAKNTVGSIVQGHGLDQVARELRERGWDIPEGDEVRALTEMLSDEIAGARAVRMGEEAEVMTAAALMDHMDEVHGKFTDAEAQAAEQFNFNDKDPRYVAEIARIRKERDKAMAEVAASAEYPLQAEAARVAREKPNLRIKVGEDAQGKAVTVPVREFLEDASRASERAAGDAKLFDAAAACLTGAT